MNPVRTLDNAEKLCEVLLDLGPIEVVAKILADVHARRLRQIADFDNFTRLPESIPPPPSSGPRDLFDEERPETAA